jgi:hypothetical protein
MVETLAWGTTQLGDETGYGRESLSTRIFLQFLKQQAWLKDENSVRRDFEKAMNLSA